MTDAKDTPAPESTTDAATKEPNKPSKKLKTSTVKDVISKGRAMTGSPADKIEMNPQVQQEDTNHETTIHTNLSGRFQPPHPGHVKLIKAIEKAANKPGHQAHIVLSHSEGDDKNPIPLEKKKEYVKKLTAPNTQVSSSSREAPSILHTAARLHQHGHHLVVHAGSDRAAEYEKTLNKYNGKEGPHGYYKFKSITVKPIGRDPDAVGVKGYSGTKVREAARSGDVESVRKALPRELHAHAGEITKQIQNVAGVEKKKKIAKEEFERAIHEFIIENSNITNVQENALKIKSLKSGIEFETILDTYAYAYNTAVMAESKTHTPEQVGFAAVNSLIANMFFAEDAPFNSISGASIRGMGYVSGSPDGDGSNYMTANIADADTKDNIMKGIVAAHNAMHAGGGEDDAKAEDDKTKKSDASVKEEKEVWDKPSPVKKHHSLSPIQKAKAKARAKAAGRPYPNMVDNMWAVNEASVLDSPEGQKKLQSVWWRAQRRAISATGDGGVLSSKGHEPGKLKQAIKVQKSAYKRIHDKNFHDKPVAEGIDSVFEEKFGKYREAIPRDTKQKHNEIDLVPRDGEDRKKDDRFYRQQSINKKVTEAKAPKWDEKEFKLVRPGMWRHHTGDSSIHYGGDNKSYTVMHGNDRDPVKYKTLDGAQKAVRAKYVKEAKQDREYDYEGDMAMSQLRSVMHNAEQICDMLKPETNLPEWVQSKITLAADYISTCRDYLESNEDDLKEDINTSFAEMSVPAGTTGKRKEWNPPMVGIRMANGKIEKHPPGKSGSSGGGDGGE